MTTPAPSPVRNHEEATHLACSTMLTSNLARCYLELVEQISANDEWKARAEKAEAELAELRKASDIVSKSQARRIVASADDNSPGADSHDDTDVRKELDEQTAERVARAMHRQVEEEDWQGWEDLDAMQKSELRQMARAAIAAMRGGKGEG